MRLLETKELILAPGGTKSVPPEIGMDRGPVTLKTGWLGSLYLLHFDSSILKFTVVNLGYFKLDCQLLRF